MDYWLEKTSSSKEAFKKMAEQYEEAAKVCKRMAGFAAENNVKVSACSYDIFVETDPLAAAGLVADKILNEEPDYNDDDDEDDGFYDDEEEYFGDED